MQFHDGLGFLTSHALLANTFESNLQLVDPKLTLPYWDFTIEGSTPNEGDGDGIFEPQALSPLFHTSWFGSSDPVDQQASSWLPRHPTGSFSRSDVSATAASLVLL